MKNLSIMVPSDSAIESYLSHQPVVYRITQETSASVVFSYGGTIPPLAKISQLLVMFEPAQYTISKSMTGFSFIVWPNE